MKNSLFYLFFSSSPNSDFNACTISKKLSTLSIAISLISKRTMFVRLLRCIFTLEGQNIIFSYFRGQISLDGVGLKLNIWIGYYIYHQKIAFTIRFIMECGSSCGKNNYTEHNNCVRTTFVVYWACVANFSFRRSLDYCCICKETC